MAPIRHQKGWACQIGEATAFGHLDSLVQGPIECNGGCHEQNAKDSCLNHSGNSTFSDRTPGIAGPCFDEPLLVDCIDVVENSTSLGNTSSSSLKNFGQLQFACSSNGALNASSLDESEAMRKWKEIKQNGFLTHPYGGIPMLEPQHGKKSKRKTKGNDLKRRLEPAKVGQDNGEKEMAKMEQDDRKVEAAKRVQNKRRLENTKRQLDGMLKTAPSSGLLARISTGIIRRVKNYEEVHAILEDMVRLERSDGQIHTEFIGREESGGKKIICETYYQNQLYQSLNRLSLPSCSGRRGKGIISDNFDGRSYPEGSTTTSCISDYNKFLSSVLTTYSNIISRKCDSILSVEHDLNRQPIPAYSKHGHVSHDTDDFEEMHLNSAHVRLSHDSDTCVESRGHDTIIASQSVLDHDKNCH